MNCKTCQKEIWYKDAVAHELDQKTIHKCSGGNGHVLDPKQESIERMHLANLESSKKLIESNHAIAKSNQDIASAIRQLAIALLEKDKK